MDRRERSRRGLKCAGSCTAARFGVRLVWEAVWEMRRRGWMGRSGESGEAMACVLHGSAIAVARLYGRLERKASRRNGVQEGKRAEQAVQG